MEKNVKTRGEHQLMLNNREKMTLTGVCEVVSFTDEQISLKTNCGDLLLRGNALNIGHLNTDTGELAVSGNITLMKYSKAKGGIFEGLLR